MGTNAIMTDEMLEAFRSMDTVIKAPEALPNPNDKLAILSRPLIEVDDLVRSRLLPMSRNGIYNAIRDGSIPSTRVGKKILIPTVALRQKLGL
jgi:excisionase family DNA binding protein